MKTCPHCKKSNVIKGGTRKNKSGFITKYICKNCNKYFTDRQGFERMRTNSEAIVTALDLRAKGMSLGKIQLHLIEKFNLKVSRKTILDWQTKFGEKIEKFTKQFILSKSENIHADEIFLREKGQRGDNFIYYWDAIDYDTKFLVADHISYERSQYESRIFINNIKNNLQKPPDKIHTDYSWDYPPSIKWVFGRKSTKHIRSLARKCTFKNNPIERYHNTLKENYKVMRKFQKIVTANKYLTFFRNYYNFLRPHKTLNWLTPAQKAGFGKWNWRTIIHL